MTKSKKKELTFNKKQLIESDKYANQQDILTVLLKEDKEYTFANVDKKISDFMKGKVK